MLEHPCGPSIECRSFHSDAEATLATKAPINPASRRYHAGNALVRTALGRPPVLAFTATAGVDAQQRIIESLDMNGKEPDIYSVQNVVFLLSC